jgi:hypothetical protein
MKNLVGAVAQVRGDDDLIARSRPGGRRQAIIAKLLPDAGAADP